MDNVVDAAKAEAARIVAEAEASVVAVPEMLFELEAVGATGVYIERALSLKIGTVAKWKLGEILPEEMALLRIIHMFPRILEVADHRFDSGVARAMVIAMAGEAMLAEAKRKATFKRVETSAVETVSATGAKKNWVDLLIVGDIFHEIKSGIEYTVTQAPDCNHQRIVVKCGTAPELLDVSVFRETVRE